MASLDAGYDRAAMLKQAARRSHFVSRIEKYEAKVKQDLKARGLLREQRIAMAPVFKTRGALEQKMHSTGKTISDKSLTVEDNRKACDSVAEKAKHDALVEHKICHLGESEDSSSEQNILAGKREILHSTLHDHCKDSDFVEGKGKSKKDDAFIERRTCQSGESEDSSEHKIISQQNEILHSTVRDHKWGFIAEKEKLKKDNAVLEHRTCHLGDRVDSSQQKIMAERMEVQHSTVLDHRACNWVAEKVKPKKIDGWLEHRTCQSGGREDSPEQKIIAEQREIPLLHRLAQSDKERATTSSSIIYHPGRSYALETKVLPAVCGQLLSACRPSAATELNIAAIAVALKIRLKAADMSPPMQEHAFRLARDILNSIDKLQCKRVAYTLKKEFDKTYGPAWHCIVGTNFGSYVTHSLGGFIYFSLEKVSVLLFKTAVEPLEH